jgi:hypothetical protein
VAIATDHFSFHYYREEISMAHSVSGFAAPIPAQARPFLAIGLGGFIVGVLDLAYAILVYSPKRPILIPQAIASGVFGERSFNGGVKTAVLGIVLHFFIALVVASVYYLASRKFAFLIQTPVLFGMVYGGLVYLFMHLIVLPLSAFQPGDMPMIYKVSEFVEHLFCVGLPVSLSVRHYARWMPTTTERSIAA